MDGRKLALATIAGWLTMEVVAFLLHQVLFGAFYDSATDVAMRRPDGKQLHIIAFGQLILSVLMAYLYPRQKHGGRGIVMAGLTFGLVIGLVWRLPHAVMEIGLYNFGVAVSLVDAFNHLLEAVAGGIAIALVYGEAVSRSPRAPAA